MNTPWALNCRYPALLVSAAICNIRKWEKTITQRWGLLAAKASVLNRARLFHNTRSADGYLQRINPTIEYINWEYLDNGQVQTSLINARLLDLTNQSGDRIWGALQLLEGSVRGADDQPLRNVGITLPIGNYSWNRSGHGE